MIRRAFIKSILALPFLGSLSSGTRLVNTKKIAGGDFLNKLVSSNYDFIFNDWHSRFPDKPLSKYRPLSSGIESAIEDLSLSLYAAEPYDINWELGWQYFYYDLLRGVIPAYYPSLGPGYREEKVESYRRESIDNVSIYIHRETPAWYVFHDNCAIALVSWFQCYD